MIKVYTTPTCTFCNKLKEYLDQKGIEYEAIDVSQDRDAAKYIMEKSGKMGVPQTEIGGQIIVGFDEAAIDDALSNET